MDVEWTTTVHDKIFRRREELGLSLGELEERSGVSWFCLGDMQGGEDEIYLGTRLGEQKRVYKVLQLDLLDLFDLECGFCREPDSPYAECSGLAPNAVAKLRREQMSLAWPQFERFVGLVPGGAARMEGDPHWFDMRCVESVFGLAEAMQVPVQLLFEYRCPKCGK
jgi:hypothetical protein